MDSRLTSSTPKHVRPLEGPNPLSIYLHTSSFWLSQKTSNQGSSVWLRIFFECGATASADGINPGEFTLHNITVNQVIQLVSRFGKGSGELCQIWRWSCISPHTSVSFEPTPFGNEMARDQCYVDLAPPFGLRLLTFLTQLLSRVLVKYYGFPDFLHNSQLSANGHSRKRTALLTDTFSNPRLTSQLNLYVYTFS